VDPAAVGAFLSGVASVITAGFYVRRQRARFEEECRKRMDALIEGIELEHKHVQD